MEKYMKEAFKMGGSMVKARMFGRMVNFMRDLGKMVRCMAKESMSG
jgi:hypothetical protein